MKKSLTDRRKKISLRKKKLSQKKKNQKKNGAADGVRSLAGTSFFEFLKEQAETHKTGFNVGIGVTNTSEIDDVQNFVNGYLGKGKKKGENYGVMSQDKNKIYAYELAIQAAVSKNHKNWLEIGPGAHAVLSQIVLGAGTNTNLWTIEGNATAADEAEKILKEKFSKERWLLEKGLSTNHEIQSRISNDVRNNVTAVVSELLGMIMSAEYVVDIMDDIQQNYVTDGVLMLPTYGATFYTPMLLELNHLKLSLKQLLREGVGVGLDPKGNWLHARKVPIFSAAVFRDTNSDPSVGVLEFINFSKPMILQKYQERVSVFRNTKKQNIIVNSLGMWIWVGFDVELPKKRISKTGYPYGYNIENEKFMPVDVPLDISSLSEEVYRGSGGVNCTNWRNVVMLFSENITILPNHSLKVTSICDFTKPYKPEYKFSAYVCNEDDVMVSGVFKSEMTTLYNDFDFEQIPKVI